MFGKGHFSLLIIPHGESRTREISISRPLLWGLYSALALSFCALVFFTIGYHVRLYQKARLEVHQAANAELRSRVDQVQRRLSAVGRRLEGFAGMDRRMRAWAGLPEPGRGVRRMGVGGAEISASWEEVVSAEAWEDLSETYTQLQRLSRQASFLEASFDSISGVLGRSEEALRHTPSICPVPPNVSYFYSSGFGYRSHPFTGQREFHNGIDIAGHEGIPILATADGVVEKVNVDKGMGVYVAIDHGSGYRTLYGHLRRRPSLKVGQKVTRGEVIGELGNTGRSTGPHLHYSVFRYKRAANPFNYFVDRRRWASIY